MPPSTPSVLLTLLLTWRRSLNGTKGPSDLYPESSVKFHHNIGKVDPLSAADKLSDLRMVVCSDVVAHKVPVDAVSAALLLVQQDV